MLKINFVVKCPAVHLLNGRISANNTKLHDGKYFYNTRLRFSCHHGYLLDTSPHGSARTTICLASAQWSHTVPNCWKSNTQLLEYKNMK